MKRDVKHTQIVSNRLSKGSQPLKSLHDCDAVQGGFVRAFWAMPLLTFLIIGSLVFSTSHRSLAADNGSAGSDPAHPLFPTDSWVALKNGEQQWYAFREEGDGTPIVVRMTVLPAQGATFRVLTAEGVSAWERGGDLQPIGAGSVLDLFPNDYYWTGSFVQSGTYYVLIESQGRGQSNYKLSIMGKGISFPLLSFAQLRTAESIPRNGYPIGSSLTVTPQLILQLTPQPTVQFTPAAAPTVLADQPSSSPENPLPPIGKPESIAPGETHWYGFRDEGDESTIQVSADAIPDDCLAFELWTPEQLRLWQLGSAFIPVGQGTANPSLNADLFWAGGFVKSGIYYVVVKRDPSVSGTCSYKLQVTGDDVSLLLTD